MRLILPDITTLEQYKLKQTAQPETLRPKQCWNCNMTGLHCHATYERQSDRENKGGDSLNPIIIQRYICPKHMIYQSELWRMPTRLSGALLKPSMQVIFGMVMSCMAPGFKHPTVSVKFIWSLLWMMHLV